MQHLYIPANEVKPGDILIKVSRFPVARKVENLPTIMFTFKGTEYKRHTSYGGPDFGWECFYVKRESK